MWADVCGRSGVDCTGCPAWRRSRLFPHTSESRPWIGPECQSGRLRLVHESRSAYTSVHYSRSRRAQVEAYRDAELSRTPRPGDRPVRRGTQEIRSVVHASPMFSPCLASVADLGQTSRHLQQTAEQDEGDKAPTRNDVHRGGGSEQRGPMTGEQLISLARTAAHER